MSNKITHIGQLKPDQRNPRRHNQRNLSVITDSLQQVGFARSIVIDEDGTILAGNGVTEAAAIAGIEKVVEIEADGETIVAVRRRGLSDEQKVKLKYYDNRSGELAEWDPLVIVSDLELGIDLSSLWNPDELSVMLEGAADSLLGGDGAEDVEPQIDKAKELQEKWGTELGQVWQLGEHRIVCGDCTDAAVVEMVMRGERAQMAFADPPYGAKFDSAKYGSPSQFDGKELKNDGLQGDGLRAFARDVVGVFSMLLKEGGVVYCCGMTLNFHIWYPALSDHFKVQNVIIWVKDNPALGLSDFQWGYELIMYGFDKRGKRKWNGGRTQTDVWNFRNVNSFGYVKDDGSRNAKNDAQIHPTQKPLDLVAHAIGLSSDPGDIVADPFLGSGTTLIACENLKRKCRGIEIDPGYLAVTIQRWADLTARDPIRLSE